METINDPNRMIEASEQDLLPAITESADFNSALLPENAPTTQLPTVESIAAGRNHDAEARADEFKERWNTASWLEDQGFVKVDTVK